MSALHQIAIPNCTPFYFVRGPREAGRRVTQPSCLYAGDLEKPQLGLTGEVWQELAAGVDTILHNGALVNHAFTYEQLFEPNVLGSVEVRGLFRGAQDNVQQPATPQLLRMHVHMLQSHVCTLQRSLLSLHLHMHSSGMFSVVI